MNRILNEPINRMKSLLLKGFREFARVIIKEKISTCTKSEFPISH